jgi:hypothetical protein
MIIHVSLLGMFREALSTAQTTEWQNIGEG